MKRRRTRNILIMIVIVVAWLLVDQATKAYFGSFALGEHIASPIPGVIDFTLVHNTGGAWGMMESMTFVLGIVSIVVCLAAVAYLVLVPSTSVPGAVGLALVVAGGLGNAIDRFWHGYVIDFIEPAFIDFPVFNVADIGVTCGVVLFLISLVMEWKRATPEDDGGDRGSGPSQRESRDAE